ncbi:hypothetical protein RAN53_02255 [Halomonas sp. SSL-5]|uniref:hypothetical protein n=1 Tax=Halomonas sp. SSL-5 TaxID=3065855 RepID=UPI00273981C3|nr:hypothetical protein [Halomonas sp. SSL-5]MDY7115161.1 hypothetical protein [Halomonas sp. SSL-5]
MSTIQAEVIERMKADLLARLEEWVGMNLPVKGSEDYEFWQSKLAEIDSIENFQDVIDYVDSEGFDLNDFFLCGEYEVISAGLDPSLVPSDLYTELGEPVAEQAWSGGSGVKIYLYDGKYFVVSEVEVKVANTETDAFKMGGIDNDTFGDISHSQVRPSEPDAQIEVPRATKAPPKKARISKRPVLVVVTEWPGGTMAIKFGCAMQAALDVSKDDMSLVQMSPERIFRVETKVSEAEFREAMRVRDVASGGCVLFIEIPKS